MGTKKANLIDISFDNLIYSEGLCSIIKLYFYKIE